MKQEPGISAAAFLLGFFCYGLIEIAGRGYTHWTMCLLGGTAMALLCEMDAVLDEPLRTRALLGAMFVSAAEFTVGVFDNLIMGWRVWDYSERPLNLLGQVCPLFSVLWYLLCLAGCLVCGPLRRRYAQGASPRRR